MRGYETLLKLAGLFLLKRDMVAVFDGIGLDGVLGTYFPGEELPEDQRALVLACAGSQVMRLGLQIWWAGYDGLQALGMLPKLAAPWLNGK